MKFAIVDTNVIVAGLASRSPDSPPRRLLDAMLHGRVRYAVSAALLREYHEVLCRPRLQALAGLQLPQVAALVRRLAEGASLRSPARAGVAAPDPNDQHLLDLAVDVPRSTLVTGDKLLFCLRDMGMDVATPAAFVAELGL